MLVSSTADNHVPLSDEEKIAIQQQLERLLLNPHFSNSKRFPSFLRYVVTQTIEGKSELLKERVLGFAVFNRKPDYDTTLDPIVRVTAVEIRKRIAQYYQEPGHEEELRISLPPGSYVPRFDNPKTPNSYHAGTVFEPAFDSASVVSTSGIRGRGRLWAEWVILITLGLLLLLAGNAFALWWMHRPKPLTAQEIFWSPLFSSSEMITLCVADQSRIGIYLRDAQDTSKQNMLQESVSAVVIDDLSTLTKIAGLLEARKRRYQLRGEESATLTDLRQGPTILVGAFDNTWTLRFTRNLRFHFANDPEMKHFWIEDANSPTYQRWGIDRGQQEATNNYKDYAIVARFIDASTGKPTVIAAGIARGGTVAAGEFLTEPSNLEAFAAHAPKSWMNGNMEVVLSTEIIDGRSAPPHVEAVTYW